MRGWSQWWRKALRWFPVANMQMSFAKCAARKAGQRILEVTLRPTIWKGYLFHVITVTRYALQETAWSCTKVDSINELYILKLIFEAELLLGFWSWSLFEILRLKFGQDIGAEVSFIFWGQILINLWCDLKSVTLVFGESTQPLGLQCLWQCLFLMFQDF